MDWKARIEALIKLGLTVEEIASVMGVTVYAIRELRNGNTRSPRYNAATALIALCRRNGIEDAA